MRRPLTDTDRVHRPRGILNSCRNHLPVARWDCIAGHCRWAPQRRILAASAPCRPWPGAAAGGVRDRGAPRLLAENVLRRSRTTSDIQLKRDRLERSCPVRVRHSRRANRAPSGVCPLEASWLICGGARGRSARPAVTTSGEQPLPKPASRRRLIQDPVTVVAAGRRFIRSAAPPRASARARCSRMKDEVFLRVRDQLPHKVPRRLIQAEGDDSWLSCHSLSRFP
jgi:hypothetical protein